MNICKNCDLGLKRDDCSDYEFKECQERIEMDEDYQWIKEQGMEDVFREMALKEYSHMTKE